MNRTANAQAGTRALYSLLKPVFARRRDLAEVSQGEISEEAEDERVGCLRCF